MKERKLRFDETTKDTDQTKNTKRGDGQREKK